MFFFFQAEDGIRDTSVTGVQTCALPICFSTRSAWYSSTSPTRICAETAWSESLCVLTQKESTKAVLVQSHADGGIHADLIERCDLAFGSDAAGRDDRVVGRVAQCAKPL